jgi:hypothetical protein
VGGFSDAEKTCSKGLGTPWNDAIAADPQGHSAQTHVAYVVEISRSFR